MTFRFFAVNLRLLLLLQRPLNLLQVHAGHALLQVALLVCALSLLPPGAAGAPTNTTLHFDSQPVSFTLGWKAAQFPPTGDTFAFTNAPNESLQIVLPPNTSEVFYQGFTASGGSRFVACVDCDLSDASGGSQQVVVDAHDQAQDGQQPPRTLFSFVGLDTNTSHTLTVKNLQDGRFGNTSQLTFDSLIVTQGEPADDTAPGGNPSSSDPGTGGPSTAITVSTITVTATSTDSQSAGSTPPPTTTTTGVSVSPTVINAPPESTSTDTTTESSTATPTAPTSSLPTIILPPQSQTTTPTGSSGTSPTDSTSPPSTGGSGNPGSTPAPTGSDASTPSSSSSSSPSSAPGADNQANNNGVSKPVIIVVAVVASLVVLALLAAIVWLLMRSQPPPTARDPERGGGLAQAAAPMASVSEPAVRPPPPPRPANPFVDTVPANTPIEPELESPDVMTQPQPRTVLPPPIPPKSPLRATYNSTGRPPAWLNRPIAQRTPSPTSPIE